MKRSAHLRAFGRVTRAHHVTPAVLAALTIVALSACQGRADRTPTATVDTLESGVVYVLNPRPSTNEPTFELVEELRVGRFEGDGPDVFGEIWDLALDVRGNIYALDASAKQVRAFAADGSHLWSAGQEGEGPGELSFPVGLTIDDGGRIWVADPGNGRYVVFDDGELVEEHTRSVRSGIVPWNGGFDRSGRLWDSWDIYPPGVVVALGLVGLDRELAPTDSVTVARVVDGYFRERDGTWSGWHIPFAPWVVWRFDPRGYAFSGDAGRYTIHQLALSGDTLLTLELPYDPVEVRGEELDSAWAGLERARGAGAVVELSLIPRVKPAFEALYVGRDGRVWTYLHLDGDALSPAPSETRLDVFGADGVHRGTARATVRLEPFQPTPLFTSTHVYAVALDDFGVQYVVRLRIEPAG